MGDLLSSRWAPSASSQYNNPPLRRHRSETPIRTHPKNPSPSRTQPTPTSTPISNLLPPSEELARFMKIVSRLRWKLPFLAEAYRLATLPDVAGGGLDSADDHQHAEIMFKIDFHEYYALLERAIVHLLAIFNISVSSRNNPSTRPSNNPGIHRYHANVLSALEEESTPLTPVLGSGKTIHLLRQAKELRNRWKTADMTDAEKESDPIGDRSGVIPLSSYNFEEIISGIFAGLEEGYIRAKTHVDLCRRPGDDSYDFGGSRESEADWDFMVDAMDWEAV
ncbi:uncharacterized protein N7469_009204 [Penicillium citrinum]|uniref:Fungal specific transcription factor n=1 Tax=Penicillium citrinum TaxID=5077 RepID=A0A9W9THS5_PENCI|nr:uncharacterized protein N7469_009204 [Penicillium citrinum]KAJ5222964.1 hypothetical protein N7469_009204 [Penicillium citrinum]